MQQKHAVLRDPTTPPVIHVSARPENTFILTWKRRTPRVFQGGETSSSVFCPPVSRTSLRYDSPLARKQVNPARVKVGDTDRRAEPEHFLINISDHKVFVDAFSLSGGF